MTCTGIGIERGRMQPPRGLEARGQEFWDAVTAEHQLDASGYVLLGEIARTADTIERLSAALRSNSQEWVRLSEEAEEISEGAIRVQIVVNPILGEVRAQRLALRQLLAHLKLGTTEVGTGEASTLEKLMASFSLD
jgi:TRAP-type C4-dicarboxylate transport system substrate-binding protein